MKRTIGLNEFELKRMIAESVRRVLKENSENEFITAWENFWEGLRRKRGNSRSINWQVYDKYKDNPEAIEDWFRRWKIDYTRFLDMNNYPFYRDDEL